MIEIKNNRLKFAILSGVLLIILSVLIFLLMRDPRIVKGVGKIEARYELSMSNLTSGRTNAIGKFYATIDGQQYRLMPMVPTGENITISNGDYLIEGVVPQFDRNINTSDLNNGLSKELLSEGSKIFKKICHAKPEYAEIENSYDLSRRLAVYINDGNYPSIKIMITLNIKPINR
jgi:hypothetical protein